jgi:glycine/D-amino acid oxidase-like deaminating enzyme
MGPPVDPVQSDTTPPARTGVVVIGGGIAGVSTAFHLAAKGVSVVLCEKGEIAGEQSSRNWGWVRKMGRDPRELPLIIESLRQWKELNATVGAETGFRATGIMFLCENDAQVAEREAWLEHARQYQLDTRLIGADEIAELLPGATRTWKAALYTASDGRGEPQMAAPAIAAAARARGAQLFTQCAVRGIETKGGRVAAVVTEKGRIDCESVVLAGGAWSRLFCGNLGLNLPQLKVRSSVLRTAPVEGGPETAAVGAGFGYRKRLDGGYNLGYSLNTHAEIVPDSFRLFFDYMPAYRIERKALTLRLSERFMEEWRTPRRWSLNEMSPFEKTRTLDPAPIESDLTSARKSLAETFPVFANVPVAQAWAGYIDVTPDAVPVISPVESVPGFFIATGFSGHGFGIGPGAGRLMAELVTGAPPCVDPAPFRFARFSDGTKLRPQVGI